MSGVHYLVKPFTFSTVRDRLKRYQAYRSQVAEARSLVE